VTRSANRRWASVAVAFGCLFGAPAAAAADAGLGSSTFLGGTDHEAINDVAVDGAGNVYVTGWTQSADFPVRGSLFGWTGGPPDACDYDGCADAFVAKYAPGGRSLIYATYLSGSRHDEGTAIAVDAAGHAYVAGLSNSGDFPAGGDPQRAGSGAFVAKLAPDGSALEWFRRLGPTKGRGADDIALAGDDLYVVGTNEDMDFPATAGAYDRVCKDPRYPDRCVDTFVARYTTAGQPLAATLLGGDNSWEQGTAIAIDSAGRPVIAGHVGLASYGFPTTPGTYDQTPDEGGTEAFAARLSPDLSRLEWAATFGGDDFDDTLDMVLDSQDRPVLVGFTNSRDFPTTPGAVDRLCNNSAEWYDCPDKTDGFATKMAADGSALLWSTYIGGFGDDAAYAVAMDRQGDVYLTGTTSHEGTFPLKDPYQADVRYDRASCDHSWYCDDAFLVRLSGAGSLVYGTLLGGGSEDAGHGVAVDPEGDAWLGGHAFSSDFPVSSTAVQPARAGGECPRWQYYDNPECSDGFLSELDFAPGQTGPPPGSTPQPVAAAADPTPPGQSARSGSARRDLTVARRGRRLSGRIRGDSGCVARARLVLERRTHARWRTVRRLRTGPTGRFSTRLPSRVGRYRVRAPALPGCRAVSARA